MKPLRIKLLCIEFIINLGIDWLCDFWWVFWCNHMGGVIRINKDRYIFRGEGREALITGILLMVSL